MNISSLLGIIGVLATVAFGIWAVILGVRHKYPGQITFVKEKTIALFDEIARNLPLTILYQDKPVSPNVVLVKGAFINTGKKDITPAMTSKPITLHLPEHCKWLNATVIDSSSDVVATFENAKEDTVELKMGLLRCGEFIQFQALAELPTSDQTLHKAKHPGLDELLHFDHRIEDTQRVRSFEPRTPRLSHLITLVVGAILLGALSFWFFDISKPSAPSELLEGREFTYSFRSTDNTEIQVVAEPTADSEVTIKGVDTAYREVLPVDEFFSRLDGTPSIRKRPSRSGSWEFNYKFRAKDGKEIRAIAEPVGSSTVAIHATDGHYEEELPAAQFFSHLIGTPSIQQQTMRPSVYQEFRYKFRNKDGKEIKVTAEPTGDSTVGVHGIESHYEEELPISEFLSRTVGTPFIEKRSLETVEVGPDTTPRILAIVYAGISVLTLVYCLIELQRYRKRRRLLREISMS